MTKQRDEKIAGIPVREIVDMRLQGMSFDKIAEAFGVKKIQIYGYYRESAEDGFGGYMPKVSLPLLRNLLADRNKSMKDIALALGLPLSGLRNFMEDYGIAGRVMDRKTISGMIGNGKTVRQIGAYYGITPQCAERKMKELGLESTKHNSTQKQILLSRMRTVSVTGIGGTGKSVTAAMLALILSDSGAKVRLIDRDPESGAMDLLAAVACEEREGASVKVTDGLTVTAFTGSSVTKSAEQCDLQITDTSWANNSLEELLSSNVVIVTAGCTEQVDLPSVRKIFASVDRENGPKLALLPVETFRGNLSVKLEEAYRLLCEEHGALLLPPVHCDESIRGAYGDIAGLKKTRAAKKYRKAAEALAGIFG